MVARCGVAEGREVMVVCCWGVGAFVSVVGAPDEAVLLEAVDVVDGAALGWLLDTVECVAVAIEGLFFALSSRLVVVAVVASVDFGAVVVVVSPLAGCSAGLGAGGGRVIIRTTNFFSSKLYSETFFSSARILPE